MPSVDEKLLAQGDSAADRAGDIREAKKNNQRGDFERDMDVGDSENRAANFNRQKQIEKLKKGFNLKQKNKKIGSIISPLALSLAQLLRQAWIFLIKSFGLTLFWINLHVLGNLVFGPKIFCNLGEEWFMRPGTAKNPAQQKLIKEGGEKIGIIEKGGCACLNITCFIVIIFFLAIVVILLEILGDPIGFVKEVGKAVLNWTWDQIKGFFTQAGD